VYNNDLIFETPWTTPPVNAKPWFSFSRRGSGFFLSFDTPGIPFPLRTAIGRAEKPRLGIAYMRPEKKTGMGPRKKVNLKSNRNKQSVAPPGPGGAPTKIGNA